MGFHGSGASSTPIHPKWEVYSRPSPEDSDTLTSTPTPNQLNYVGQFYHVLFWFLTAIL